MELILSTNLETSLPREIGFNFEQLKAELSLKMQKYRTLVVTEDAIKEAKADRATLNKLKTALDNERKEVRVACLRPYDTFEYQIKELTGMIDEPIAAIDGQVKAFENAKKEEKRRAIEQFYKVNAKALIDLLPLAKFWDDRWLNATVKLPEVERQILAVLDKARNDIGIIQAMRCPCEQQMIDRYLQTLDMSAALAEKTRFEEQQKRIAEYQQKAAPPAREPVARVMDGTNGFEGLRPGDQVAFGGYSESAVPPLEILDFRVWVTAAQKAALKQFLMSNKIKFGRVS